MARKLSFDDTLKDARRVTSTWQTIPEFEMGEVGFADFVGVFEEARGLIDEYRAKQTELTRVRITRDVKVRELSNLLTRFRRLMFAQFGPDSIQYSQAGGTRESERKPRKRKARAG